MFDLKGNTFPRVAHGAPQKDGEIIVLWESLSTWTEERRGALGLGNDRLGPLSYVGQWKKKKKRLRNEEIIKVKLMDRKETCTIAKKKQEINEFEIYQTKDSVYHTTPFSMLQCDGTDGPYITHKCPSLYENRFYKTSSKEVLQHIFSRYVFIAYFEF